MISGTDSESGLSVDPEDLGTHFLSEAIEQGNFHSVSGGQGLELSIASSPPSDEALAGPNFESEHSVWEQTVDLALQNPELQGMSGTGEPAGTQQEERDNLGRDSDVRTTDSHIRELSLFDRESDEPGETTEPEAPAEDGGRHARQTSHVPLGAQVENTQRHARSKSVAKRAPKLLGGTRSALQGVASKLRHVASKLEQSIPGSRRSR
jgi:hypothetical protein